jgi:hypothetical protein
VRFTAGGRELLLLDRTVPVLWNYDAQGGRRAVPVPLGRPGVLTFAPSERVVAFSSTSGTVAQFDLGTGQRIGESMVQPVPVQALNYSPDSSVLAVTCQDNAVRLWDGVTGLPLGPPLLHASAVLAAGFSPDGREVVTATAAGEVERWPVPGLVPDDPDLLELWMQAATGRRADGVETVLLDLNTWRSKREELRRRWPEAAAEPDPHPGEDVVWHEGRAREAEATGNAHAALWHLDRLARLRPDDWRLQARRGAVLADAGEYEAAAAAFDEAEKQGGSGLPDWYAHGAVVARNVGRRELAQWYRDRLEAVQARTQESCPFRHLVRFGILE